MICAVCYSTTIDGLKHQVELAKKSKVNLIEIRIDGLETIDNSQIQEVMSIINLPIILTARSEWKKVSIDPPDSKSRNEILLKLIELKPQYIDLEFPHDLSIASQVPKSMTIVLSLMDWDGLAKIYIDDAMDLASKYDNLIVKILATPRTVSDLKRLWRWSKRLHKAKVPFVIIGMGELGKITRIKSLEMNNQWMYGVIEKGLGEPYLPGMVTVDMLQLSFSDDAWHISSIGPYNEIESKIYDPIFNKIIKSADLNGIYLNLPISNRAELDQLLLWVNDGLLDGVRILDPWQSEVIQKLDKLDPSAIYTGKCDCVALSKDGLVGYNTTVEGVRRVLAPYGIKAIKRVYIEGGTLYCRSIIAALKESSELIVVRVKEEYEFESLKQDFPILTSANDSFTEDFDLVIQNQLPEPGFERISPIPPKILKNARIVFDIASSFSLNSETIKMAKSNDINTISSWDFHINSTIIAFELWTNRSIPASELTPNSIFEENLNSNLQE